RRGAGVAAVLVANANCCTCSIGPASRRCGRPRPAPRLSDVTDLGSISVMRIHACRPGCLPQLFMAASLLLAPAAARGEPPRSILRGVEPAHWRVVWTFDPAREAT